MKEKTRAKERKGRRSSMALNVNIYKSYTHRELACYNVNLISIRTINLALCLSSSEVVHPIRTVYLNFCCIWQAIGGSWHPQLNLMSSMHSCVLDCSWYLLSLSLSLCLLWCSFYCLVEMKTRWREWREQMLDWSLASCIAPVITAHEQYQLVLNTSAFKALENACPPHAKAMPGSPVFSM
jgi:hypothetical protein